MTCRKARVELTGVNHVVYPVRDVQKAMAFYVDFLGLKQVPVMHPDVPPERMVWLRLPDKTMVHLVKSNIVPASNPVHTAFEVADFDAATCALEERGIPAERRGVRKDGQRYVYFLDPDGNRIELCTPSGF